MQKLVMLTLIISTLGYAADSNQLTKEDQTKLIKKWVQLKHLDVKLKKLTLDIEIAKNQNKYYLFSKLGYKGPDYGADVLATLGMPDNSSEYNALLEQYNVFQKQYDKLHIKISKETCPLPDADFYKLDAQANDIFGKESNCY